jgi:hypothetical protein
VPAATELATSKQQSTMPVMASGVRLFAEAARLSAPRLIRESIARGPESPLWRLFAMTYRSMFPHIARLEPALTEVGDLDTLAERLMAAATAARAQIPSRPESFAWAINP